MAATHVVDFKNWPDLANQKQFGCQEVSTLTQHFARFLRRENLDESQIKLEWEMLKVKIYGDGWEQRLQTITWREINRRLSSELPNLLPLVDLILSLPSTSADCERGFSAMKLIKTEHRSSLLPSTLDDLMMVHINAPAIANFDPQPSVNDWVHAKSRKVGSKSSDEKNDSNDEESDSDCSMDPLDHQLSSDDET